MISGWKGFIFKEKLNILKSELIRWNLEVFGNIDYKIRSLEDSISDLDVKAEAGQLLESELEQRRSLFLELWGKMKDRDNLLRQKSHQRWITEGDANTSYFHACIEARRRKNQVVALKVDDV